MNIAHLSFGVCSLIIHVIQEAMLNIPYSNYKKQKIKYLNNERHK